MTIGPKSVLAANTTFDCTLDLLPSAKPLKNRAPVHFHAGTAEVQAQVRTLDNRPHIEPGVTTLVRIVLREPLLLLPGDRFIIRMFSPVTTIGGGKSLIASTAPHPPGCACTSHRSPRLKHVAGTNRAPDRGRAHGLPVSDIVARTGAKPSAIPTSIPRFGDWLMDSGVLARKLASFRQILQTFHKGNPLLPGANKEEFRSRAFPNAPPSVFEAVWQRRKTSKLRENTFA